MYDSKADTLEHILKVNEFLMIIVKELITRGMRHDQSKLGPTEKPYFDEETPKLRTLTYNSSEYHASLRALGPALEHHYAMNDHHPEHYKLGLHGMDLLSLTEMFADWCAAAQRTKGATMNLEASFKRFGFDQQLADVFRNTAERLGIPTVQS